MDSVVRGLFGRMSPKDIAEDLLNLNDFVNRFRSMDRATFYKGPDGKERNGEHTWQVGFMAKQANRRAKLGLNEERLGRMADAHDTVEVYARDTPMFPHLYSEKDLDPTRDDKKEREEAAYVRIKEEYEASFPDFVQDIRDYLDGANDEALFIGAFEKLLSVMNIFQDNGRAWRMYGVPLEVADAKHRARACAHPAVAEWYEIVLDIVWNDAANRPNLYPPPLPTGAVRRKVE